MEARGKGRRLESRKLTHRTIKSSSRALAEARGLLERRGAFTRLLDGRLQQALLLAQMLECALALRRRLRPCHRRRRGTVACLRRIRWAHRRLRISLRIIGLGRHLRSLLIPRLGLGARTHEDLESVGAGAGLGDRRAQRVGTRRHLGQRCLTHCLALCRRFGRLTLELRGHVT